MTMEKKKFTQGTLAIKYHKVLIVYYKRNWKRKSECCLAFLILILPEAKPFVLVACSPSEQNSSWEKGPLEAQADWIPALAGGLKRLGPHGNTKEACCETRFCPPGSWKT